MPSIRVMTFNVLYERARIPGGWAARRPHVVGAIRGQAPDVACLQEVSGRQANDLASLLPEYEVVPGPASGASVIARRSFKVGSSVALGLLLAVGAAWWLAGPRDLLSMRSALWLGAIAACGIASMPVALWLLSRFLHGDFVENGAHCAILWRRDGFRRLAEGAFWISANPDRAGSVLRGTYAPHVVHWVRLEHAGSGHALTIYNAHLGHGPWTHRTIAYLLRRRLDADWDGSAQVLAGDLNAHPASGLLRRLLTPLPGSHAPALLDAWREAESRHGSDASFHWRRNFRAWPGRIDHVLMRPRLRVSRADIPPAGGPFGSDHDPVVVDVHLEFGLDGATSRR